jgi:hypothetical protein
MPATELEALCYARYEAARGEEASVEHQRELVKRLLQKLPESERTVVTLYYLAEMTSEEVSAFLGVSPNTVRSRLRRARKRLKEQEHLLHDVSGVFQLPPTLAENIVSEIAHIKPASSPASKPWLPWGLSFASTVLVILMLGFGTRTVSRFQQPYNLDATSEMTIELVEAPALLALERKQDLRNQHGLAAVAAARHAGVPPAMASRALAGFKAPKRRMEVIAQRSNLRVYDDFAHHPTAIRATLRGLRAHVGNERIIAVIEPRTHTMSLGTLQGDLATCCAEADQAIWFRGENIRWDVGQVVRASPVPATIETDIGRLVETITAQQGGAPCHVVLMSNGAFGGIYAKLRERLA